ncbi:MAG TPA: hypothetical protein VGR12_08510 [Solirubrobacteraceae bacterium]|nr:hypothetical protein [Solirubrobacteraceae bacterium]
MKKLLMAFLTTALVAIGGGTALADDDGYVADPRQKEKSEQQERCQAVGDDRAGENDNTGLQRAVDTAVSVIEQEDDEEECDNSGGRRP